MLDFSSPLHNLLFAAGVASHASRIQPSPVEIRIRLQSQPPGDTSDLPVTIILVFHFSIDFASISKPVNILPFISAEAQRRFLSFIFPHPQTMETFEGETDIRYFFSCLRPASALPESIEASFLQPRDLKVQLLPFQRRSLFFLLQSEGYTLDSSGRVIQLADTNDSPFWEYLDVHLDVYVQAILQCL